MRVTDRNQVFAILTFAPSRPKGIQIIQLLRFKASISFAISAIASPESTRVSALSCLIFVDVPVVTIGKRDGSERRTAIAGIITLPQSIPELESEAFPIVATWNSGREAAEHVIHRDLQAGDFYRRVGERPAPFERILQRGAHPMMYPDWYSVCDEALDGLSANGASKAMREIEAGAEPLIAIDISEADEHIVLRQIEQHRQHLERFVVVEDRLYIRIAEPYLALIHWSDAYHFVPIDEPDDLIEVPVAIFPLPNYDEAAAWLSRSCRPGPEVTVAPYDCRRPDLFSKSLRSENLALFVPRAERAVVEYMRMLPPWRYASFMIASFGVV